MKVSMPYIVIEELGLDAAQINIIDTFGLEDATQIELSINDLEHLHKMTALFLEKRKEKDCLLKPKKEVK